MKKWIKKILKMWKVPAGAMVLLVFFLLQLNAVAAEPEATVQYLHDSSAATITLSAKSNDTVTNGIAYLQGQVDKAGTLELYVNGEKKGSDTLEAGDTFDFSDIALREERNSVELRHVGSAGTTRQLYNFYYLIEWDILVDGSFAGTDGNPGTDGIPVYKTVGAAVVSVPATNDAEKIIYIKSGTYNERVVVTSPYITLLGEDRANTTIYYSINTYDTVQSGLDSSYRNAVKIDATAVHFHGENLTFENSATYTNGTDQQAEALRVLADQSSFVNVKLVSFLNTLLVGRTSGSSTPIRVYFENCYITGNDSFIYGDASAYFQDCQIVARYTKDKSGGTYVRPGTGIDGEGSNNPGFVFSDCAFEAEAGVTPDSHTLATSNSNSASVTFLNCYMSEEVNANSPYTDSNSAWDPTFGKGSNKEYQSYGEGVDTSGTANRPQIETAAEAANYDAEDILAPPGGGEAFEVPTYNPSTESANSLYLKTGTSDSTGGLFIGSKESTTLAYPGRGTKWTWDYETKTLTIKENTEFTTKADTALVLTCDTTFSITGNLSLNGNKYGIKSENGDDITVSDGEIVTSGSVAAISTAGMLSLPTAYQYYTNTEPTAPAGDGTIYPSVGTSAFTNSFTYQYVKIASLALYQVVLDKNDGTAASSLGYVAEGGSIAEPTAPTRTGFSFDGWYLETACTNDWDFTSDTVTASLTSGRTFTLYAKWTDIKVPELSAGSISRTSDTQATIGFTTDENVTVYYQVVNDDANMSATGSWTSWISIGAKSAGTVSGESITLSAGVKDVYLAAVDATGNVGTMKLDANSIVTLTVQKDGAAYAAHGKMFSLYQSEVKKYDGIGTGGTVTFSNVVSGSYDVYEGTTDTGLSINVTDSVSGSGTLSYYTVQYAVADSRSASGSTVSALYNGVAVTNGSVVLGGKTLSVTAAGAGADLYTYAWSGTGSNSETTSTINFTSLGQGVNLTCTVNGTTEISDAKTAVEGATYSTTQADTATEDDAKTYVQGIVNVLSAITGKSVTPSYNWGAYTAPIAGSTTDLDGTNGSLTFTVTLSKAGGTAKTTSTLTLTITATPYDATQDNAVITAAKTAVEGATFTTTQGNTATEAAAQTYVESTVNALLTTEGTSVSPIFNWDTYVAPTAGSTTDLDGTNGSLTFTVTLNKGGGTAKTTSTLTLTITATAYDATQDNADIAAAKTAVEGAAYTTTQADTAFEAAAKTYIQGIVNNLSAITVKSVTPTFNFGTYKAPTAGSTTDLDGTNGSLAFTVTLNKGGGTAKTTSTLTLTITATAYDATQDNADIAVAKTAVEGAAYTTPQANTASEDAAKTYIQSIINALSAITEKSVLPTFNWGTYTAPTAGSTTDLDGTNGSLTFTVTLNKGGGTAQTTSSRTLTITATPYDNTQDNTDIAAAKTAVEGAAYTTTQANTTTEAAAKTYVQGIVNALSAITVKSVIPTFNFGTYTAPTAGSTTDLDGTNGSLTFTVTLNKGGGTAQITDSKTLTITATPYDATQDNIDIAAAKTTVEGAPYTTTQEATSTEEAAQTYVQGIVNNLSAITGKSVIPTFNFGTYDTPTAGTTTDLDGTNGSLTFTVTLNKGGGTAKTTSTLTLTITATAYDATQDNADIVAAKTAVEGATYTTTQADTATEDAAKTYVQGIVNALSAITVKSVIPTFNFGTYATPTAGSTTDLDGTNGSLAFTVTLNKGGGTAQITDSKTLTITATPYDATQDNADIAAAKTAVEGAPYTTTQEATSTEEAAQTYVQGIVNNLSAITGKSVIPTFNFGTYDTPTAGTTTDLDGTNGSLTFTVTLNKGGGTAKTTSTLTLTITATAYDATQDNADIAAAKTAVEGATYTITQADTATEDAAKTYVQGIVNALSAITVKSVTPTFNFGTYTAPTAGSTTDLDGTNGSLTFTITLNKGGGTAQTTSSRTLTITATPYDATQDNADIAAAKTAVEGAAYTTTQSNTATEDEAKTYVQSIVNALSAITGASVTPTINFGTYTAPTAGSTTNLDGTDGSLSFTVTLNKGGGTVKTTSTLTLTITATPYDASRDNTDISAAKTAVEGTTFTTTQAATATEAAAKTYVQGVVAALSAIDEEGVTPSYNWVEYTAPTAGVVGNLNGTNGSLTFNVTLNKGGGTAQTTSSLTLTITATAYDATQDNADIAAAKTAVERAVYSTAQANTATKEAAKTYVQGIVNALSAITGKSVISTYNFGTYTAPTAGSTTDLDGTNGSLTFNVTLNKGGGTAQTTSSLTLTITATAYDATQDNADIAAAKIAVEGAVYSTAQANTATKEAAQTCIQGIVNNLSAITGASVIPTFNFGTYAAPTAGTTTDLDGTNGSLTFTVTLNKGGGTAQTTDSKTLTITATPYDATKDNADITAAKTAVEGATYTTPQANTATEDAAKTYIQSIINALSAITEKSVLPTFNWGTYTAPTAGSTTDLDGTNGSLTFTITLNKGGGTAKTTSSLTLTITATAYDATQDNADLSAAKTAVEGAAHSTTQANTATEDAAKTYIQSIINALSAITEKSVLPTFNFGTYTAPTAGSTTDLDGTNGSLTFTVTLNKGGGTAKTTSTLTLTITATAYDATQDNADIAAAKTAVEGAAYTTTQADTATEAAAQTYIQGIVNNLSAITGKSVIPTYNFGTYTAPTAGSTTDLDGTNGSLNFTVTLNKGGGTAQIADSKTLTITATPYDATQDIIDIAAAKTAVEGAPYTTTQEATSTEEAAQTYVQGIVNNLSAITGKSVTPTINFGTYAAPTAGTTTDLEGTNGSLTFTVTLNKGGGTAQTTNTLSLTITATPYDTTQDNGDLATAKTAVENEAYQIAQSTLIEATVSGGDVSGGDASGGDALTDAAIEASAKAYVKSTIENIAAIKDASITATFTWGTYTPAQAGTPANLSGTNGSLLFTLQLQKGAGTPVVIDNLSLSIIATPYDTNPDNADITTARLLIEGARYQDSQANLPDHDTTMNKIQTILSGLALDGVTTAIVEEGYTSPIAGTAVNPTGTNGSLAFHVTLNKGGGTQQNSDTLTLTILATGYIPPAPTIPAGDGMVEVEYEGEGSDIILQLPQEKIEELLANTTDDNVVFHLSLNGAISEVSVPASAIQAFLDAGKGIEVEMAAGSITLSNDALRSFLSASPGSEIAFQAQQMPVATLSSTQQAVLAPGDVVYDLAVLLDNQPVHTFDGEITLALPYTGETPVGAWYLADDGTLEKMQGTYDAVNKLFYFTPPHLSLYLIGPEKDTGAGIVLSNVYIPTTEKGEEILSAKVAVYEDAILNDGSAARIYLTGISSQVKAEAEQAAKERGMQPPFAMADVHGVGVTAGQTMTVSFNLMNVAEGNKIAVLHLLPDGTWELLSPIHVGNGTVKVTVTADSVVAFVRTADSIPRSPNSGDTESWILWVIALMMLTTGMIALCIISGSKSHKLTVCNQKFDTPTS